MPSSNITKDLISAYANNDQWETDHFEAQKCYDLEERLSWGIRLFEGLLEFESRLQRRESGKSEAEAIETLIALPSLYQVWLSASESCLKFAEEFVSKGYQLADLEAFRKAVMEARWICESAAIEEEIQPYDKVLEQLAPDNPDWERYGD